MSFSPFPPTDQDTLFLRSLSHHYSHLLSSAWPSTSDPSPFPLPLLIHARLAPPDSVDSSVGFSSAAEQDALDDSTLSYATVAEAFIRHLQKGPAYHTAEQIAEGLAQVALWDCGASKVDLAIELPSAVLHAASGTVVVSRRKEDYDFLSSSNHETHHRLATPPLLGAEDRLLINDLRVACVIGVLSHEREETQTVQVDLTCWPSRETGGEWLERSRESADDMGIGMRRLAKIVGDHIARSRFKTVEALATSIAATALALPSSPSLSSSSTHALRRISVRIAKPSAIPNAIGSGCEITRSRGPWVSRVLRAQRRDGGEDGSDGDESERGLGAMGTSVLLGGPRPLTPTRSLHTSLTPHRAAKASTSSIAGRPNGLAADAMSVSVFSTLEDPEPLQHDGSSSKHVVYLGLGSNLGDRLRNLDAAIKELEKPAEEGGAGAEVLDVSFIYETEPMFVELDHPQYLNAVCKITTPLEPIPLLDAIKGIETHMGRTQSVEKTPRPVDLDILYFDDRIVDEERLRIPHVGISKREFVLRPLHDIAPALRHPLFEETTSSLLTHVATPTASPSSSQPVRRVSSIRAVAISGHPTLIAPELDLTARTHIMAILNTTPDSFSDGGEALSLYSAVSFALQQLAAGADILDVGGMSTRPGADDVSIEEEIRRTVPVITSLRNDHGISAHISIDTFRASVARAAVEAGATIVNDVTAGLGDPDMFTTIAELGVPYVMMHSRGDPKTMSKMTVYDGGDIVAGVRRELAAQVEDALRQGVRRWNIIVDPGIGFAKDLEGNLALLRDLKGLSQHEPLFSGADGLPQPSALAGFPLLVGASRKKFLGQLTARGEGDVMQMPDPKKRDWATAATTVVAVAVGAGIVRVHNVEATRDVVAVADAIYRRGRR